MHAAAHGSVWLLTALWNAAAGAVLYAESPSTVYARRSKFAYGIEVATTWHKGLDSSKLYIEPTTKERLCSDVFDCMVGYDELVEHDQVTRHLRSLCSAIMLSGHWILQCMFASQTYIKCKLPAELRAVSKCKST